MVPEREKPNYENPELKAFAGPNCQLTYGYLDNRGLTVLLPTVSRLANRLGAWLV
jgi:hypothetical protein